LSVLRILLAPLFVFMYLQDTFLWAALGMVVFIFAAITDYLDGYYARRYNVSSGLGTFLDPLADKILTFAGFICIPFIDPGQFPWWIIVIIIIRDIFITLLRVWSEHTGLSLQTRYSAKVKTMLQMIFLYVVLLAGMISRTENPAGWFSRMLLDSGILGWVFILVMLITVYTALEYIYINRRLFTSGRSKL
jgi:CDP-diacylglycerol---glycerol-3-phosphate 3-phosphatidyltransferase